MKPIEFAVIQSGYCVFGAGSTEEAAIRDAAQWLEDENGQQGGLTIDEVRDRLEPIHNHVDGDLILMDVDDEGFDSYLENQGGYIKHSGKWYSE